MFVPPQGVCIHRPPLGRFSPSLPCKAPLKCYPLSWLTTRDLCPLPKSIPASCCFTSLWSFRPVVLSQRTCGNIWRHFGLSEPGRGVASEQGPRMS